MNLKYNWSPVFYLTILLRPTCAHPGLPGEPCVGEYPQHPFHSIMVISGFGTLGRECAERTEPLELWEKSFHPYEVIFQEQSFKSKELMTDHKPWEWTLPPFLSHQFLDGS